MADTDSNGGLGTGMIVALLLVVVIAVMFFMFGGMGGGGTTTPAPTGETGGDASIEVPEEVDVNVNEGQ